MHEISYPHNRHWIIIIRSRHMRAFPPEAQKYPFLPPYILRQVNTKAGTGYLAHENSKNEIEE